MNRESADSAKLRVQKWLLNGVRKGDWGPGDELPSQEDIAERFHVHRSTVSRVMERLVYSGLVVGPGGGRKCVTLEPMRSMALKLFNDAAEIRQMNRNVGLASPE